MTNKKKQKAKSISEKTGMSHAAAVNQLNKTRLDEPRLDEHTRFRPTDPEAVKELDAELIEALGPPLKGTVQCRSGKFLISTNGAVAPFDLWGPLLFEEDPKQFKSLLGVNRPLSFYTEDLRLPPEVYEKTPIHPEPARKEPSREERIRDGWRPAVSKHTRSSVAVPERNRGVVINYNDIRYEPLSELGKWRDLYPKALRSWKEGLARPRNTTDWSPSSATMLKAFSDLVSQRSKIPETLELIFFSSEPVDGNVEYFIAALSEGRADEIERREEPTWIRDEWKKHGRRVWVE